eukprot:1005000-Prorocentrum_minimum.AAC.1
MNWHCPTAPAHEPLYASSGMMPFSTTWRAPHTIGHTDPTIGHTRPAPLRAEPVQSAALDCHNCNEPTLSYIASLHLAGWVNSFFRWILARARRSRHVACANNRMIRLPPSCPPPGENCELNSPAVGHHREGSILGDSRSTALFQPPQIFREKAEFSGGRAA